MASQQPEFALLPDLEQDDTDSALGDSMGGSQTASLTSSVLNYKFENGRRYHSYREGTYILPNDEPEQDRLDVLHHIFRIAIDGALYCAPLEENFQPNRVLDLGTGTGIWAIDFADKFPGSVVIGIDLSPIQPIWVPPNCKFYVDDMESDWGYPLEEHFEYIHGRGLAGSIADWKELFHQAYANLKAGGWFEMQEFQNKVYSDDDTIQLVKGLIEWDDELEEASIKFGKPLRIAHLLKDWMEEAGFVEVPIGAWPKDEKYKLLGRLCMANFLEVVDPLAHALFTRVLGYPTDEATAMAAIAKNDLRNPAAHLWVPFYFVWGRKPSLPG